MDNEYMEPVSPTAPIVYEPRLWSARIWIKGGPFEGIAIDFKAPYGQAMNAATVLARAASRRQILRYAFGPTSARQMRRVDRKALQRFAPAFEAIAERYSIDWAA